MFFAVMFDSPRRATLFHSMTEMCQSNNSLMIGCLTIETIGKMVRLLHIAGNFYIGEKNMQQQRRFARLRAELSAHRVSRENLARLLKHNNRGYVDQRFTGKSSWSLDEMYALMDLLSWPVEKMHELFPRDGYDSPNSASIAVTSSPKESRTEFTCPECGNLNAVSLVGIATHDKQKVELSCPWCSATIGNIVSTRAVLVSKSQA